MANHRERQLVDVRARTLASPHRANNNLASPSSRPRISRSRTIFALYINTDDDCSSRRAASLSVVSPKHTHARRRRSFNLLVAATNYLISCCGRIFRNTSRAVNSRSNSSQAGVSLLSASIRLGDGRRRPGSASRPVGRGAVLSHDQWLCFGLRAWDPTWSAYFRRFSPCLESRQASPEQVPNRMSSRAAHHQHRPSSAAAPGQRDDSSCHLISPCASRICPPPRLGQRLAD